MSQPTVFKIHFRLAQLRARLCQAWDGGDRALAAQISTHIDACQVQLWQLEIKGRPQAS